MKVLVTGGYGFIGSHVAERFYKEGYEVFVIDNLSTGNANNLECDHKNYKVNVEDKKCDEIFRNNRFDVVVHLASQGSKGCTLDDSLYDSKNDILGLVNMLQLSVKYGVKKFIFSSSEAVYGNDLNEPITENSITNPASFYGINKRLSEEYCERWEQLYKLQTICFRLSNVYGPRQDSLGEGGVVASFMDSMIGDKSLIVYGDGTKTMDFIFVLDVVEAIYRAVESPFTGIYNLSSNTGTSLKELVHILRELHPVREVIYKESRKGEIYHSRLDNSRVKQELDWIPIYDIKEGIKITYDWYIENYISYDKDNKKAQDSSAKTKLLKVLPYIENSFVFLLVFLYEIYFKGASISKYVDIKLIYIILISISYGMRQSILAITLSCMLFTLNTILIGRDIISLLLDAGIILHLSSYILLGLYISYIINKRERMIEYERTQIKALEEKYDFLKDLYNEIYTVKQELQKQIVNSEDSFGKIYQVIKELDSLEPQYIFRAAIEVMEDALKCDEISIYTVDKTSTYMRLQVKSNKAGFDVKKTLKLTDFAEASSILLKNEIYINKDLDIEMPLLMAPIIESEKLIGVIILHSIEFERFTLYYQNLFKVTAGLISASVVRAYKYENAISSSRYIPGTFLLKSDFFHLMLDIKETAKKEGKADFSLLRIKNLTDDITEFSKKLSKCIRETDFAGVGRDGWIYLILSNSSEQDSSPVIKRLKNSGIEAEVYFGEDIYV